MQGTTDLQHLIQYSHVKASGENVRSGLGPYSPRTQLHRRQGKGEKLLSETLTLKKSD